MLFAQLTSGQLLPILGQQPLSVYRGVAQALSVYEMASLPSSLLELFCFSILRELYTILFYTRSTSCFASLLWPVMQRFVFSICGVIFGRRLSRSFSFKYYEQFQCAFFDQWYMLVTFLRF